MGMIIYSIIITFNKFESSLKKHESFKNIEKSLVSLNLPIYNGKRYFMVINRAEYLDRLIRHKDKSNLMKVLTGVRRCGKSTLLEIYQGYLKENGVSDNHMLAINLEKRENIKFRDGDVLYEHIKELTKKKKKFYVFIDELQLASDYEEVANSLRMQDNIDLYVTGSNSKILLGKSTKEKNGQTRWGGRYIEIKMLPLSFKEYASAFSQKQFSKDELFKNYLQYSSFPEALKYAQNGKYDALGVQDYLDGVYNSIIINDISNQDGIKDISLLKRIINFLFSNIGHETSIGGIADYLKNEMKLNKDETKVYSDKIAVYVSALLRAFLFYEATRYYAKGKEYIKANAKYYTVDPALRYYLLGGDENVDSGKMLENTVYLELRRRGYEVKVGRVENKEVDFVAVKPGGIVEYYQVSQTVMDSATSEREYDPLLKIKDSFPKYVLTRDWETKIVNGIKQMNVLEWLLGG